MDKLEKLYKELDESREKECKIYEKIRKIKEEKILPKNREKYEGKYWKFINSYGKKDENWLLYSFCIQVKDKNKGLFNTFQTTPKESGFAFKKIHYFHICQTEITKEEYTKALNKFKEELNNIG